ncbi:serine/threonine-protein kinase [Ideonella sp.]|uniref:serine/threonine-protein kinase n=1 Tax=Ideonella sp. TaxID=1929293 RepID=UPI002B494504|nr:serine/threonine-protein kinase [Ideonella sp.]HJV70039.1 serine/threonine-protein kinase [Ideonella sp.]
MKTLRLAQGSWTILDDEPLGAPGGFAAVYPGLSAKGDPVAIKVFHDLDPAASSRELRFATERLGKLDPHVIAILDCGIDADSGRACIVMPRAEYSLAQKLNTNGKLSEAQAVVIAHAVVSGLISVSTWVHRDLKPGNLLWLDGRWQVADFGIARQADAKTAMSTMKSWLTCAYAAPEQWNNERATHKTDVYALACVLQEVMTGEPPFSGPNEEDFAEQHRSAAPHNLAGSPRMRAVLARMLSKSPDARPELGDLEQRFAEWEASAPQTPGGQELAALAAKLAAEDMQQQAGAASAALAKRDRATIQRDAQRELSELSRALFDRVIDSAPIAVVDLGHGLTPNRSASLGHGHLTLSVGQFTSLSPDAFNESGWDVICGGTVAVSQSDGRGRSASLWYVRRWPNTPYEWIEVSYWCLVKSQHPLMEPCLLPPGRDADYAAANVMHVWNIAHSPYRLGDGGREQFIERWIARFVAVASGSYQRPSMLPEP